MRKRLVERELALELDDKGKDFLIDKGFNPDFGARPLRRAIEQYVEDMLSEAILAGEFKAGQTVRMSYKEGDERLCYEAVDGMPGEDSPQDLAASTSAETT